MLTKNNFLKIIIFFLLTGCDDPKITDTKILLGSKIFSKSCSSCHQKGMVINSNSQELKLSEIIYSVTYGAGNGMPSFKDILSTDEIEAVSYFYKKKNNYSNKIN